MYNVTSQYLKIKDGALQNTSQVAPTAIYKINIHIHIHTHHLSHTACPYLIRLSFYVHDTLNCIEKAINLNVIQDIIFL